MLTFLFWNVGGELPKSTPVSEVVSRKVRLGRILATLAKAHNVDFLILAECPLLPTEVLNLINQGSSDAYRKPDPNSQCDRITIYSRFAGRFVKLRSESPTYTCRKIRLPGHDEFLLFATHFGSKLYRSDESQTLNAPGFSRVIREEEKKAGHTRTLLAGDFNMNPFDTAMVGAEGLNAVMTRTIAAQGTRTVDRQEYPFYYNPMWSWFGDSTHEVHPVGHDDHEPPGTCYYPAKESRWYYWNMLDQVLLRPALLSAFRNRDLKILTTDGVLSFLTSRGIPNRSEISDHLPLLFRLDI